MSPSHWHKGYKYCMQRKKIPCLKSWEQRQWERKGGEAGNYKWRCTLTDYYIKAGGGSTKQLTSNSAGLHLAVTGVLQPEEPLLFDKQLSEHQILGLRKKTSLTATEASNTANLPQPGPMKSWLHAVCLLSFHSKLNLQFNCRWCDKMLHPAYSQTISDFTPLLFKI